jgi:tetratricopeptide (TPR) repeat protein
LRDAPNDADLWSWIGRTQRSLGNWDAATAAFDQARRLDPRNADLLQSIGNTAHYRHRYREAIEAYRKELVLAPDLVQPRLSLAWSYLLWTGELDTLRAVLRGLPVDADPGMGGSSVGENRLELLLMERRPDSVLALLRLMPRATGASAEATLARVRSAALAHALRGDTVAARAAYDTAAAILTSQERGHPEDSDLHGVRGVVLASLGRRAEALREALWLAQSDAYREDADVAAVRGEILGRLGETDAALADVERALARPSTVTAPLLRLLPNWDFMRGDRRFQVLLAKYANPGVP